MPANGRDHPSWVGGIRLLKHVDEALDQPKLHQMDMKKFILKNMELDPETECWNWTKRLDGSGYAPINLDGTTGFVHRLSYVLYKGPVKELYVLHKCDNPKCVNPDHLFIGTQTDNMRDASAKGRFKNRPRRFGPKSGNYKHGKYCE